MEFPLITCIHAMPNSTENLEFHSAFRRLQNNKGLFTKLLSWFAGNELVPQYLP